MKKLILIIIGTLLFNSLIQAKENWSIGVIYQPKITNMFVKPNTSDFHFRYGYETGLIFVKQISPKLDVDSRILFQKYNFIYEMSVLNYYDLAFAKEGKMKYIYSYSYLSIPITIRYELLGNNKIALGVRGGISFDKFIKKEKQIDYGADIVSNTDTPDLNLSAVVAFPIEFKINEKLGLLIEPQINSMLLNNEKNNIGDWSSRLYGIGLNLGVIF